MKKIRNLLPAVLLGVLGIWAGRWLRAVGTTTSEGPWPLGQLVGSLGLLLVASLLAIGMHEIGHAGLGRWQGFELHRLTVGPFQWQREDKRLRFRWNTSLYAAGGLVLCVPTDDQQLRRRYMALVAGGPLASLLWAGLAFTTYAFAQEWGAPLRLGLGLTGAFSGAIAVVTLLPLHLGGMASDGARLLTLWQGGAASQLELTVLVATGRSVAGTRPRDLSVTALQAALTLPDTLPFKPYLYHYLYLAALDAGHFAQAARYLETYQTKLQQLPAILHETVWLEAAFFAAAFAHDLPASQAFQAQAVPSVLTARDIAFRVAAAQARLVGDAQQAGVQAQRSLRELARNLDRGSSAFYADWLRETIQWAAGRES